MAKAKKSSSKRSRSAKKTIPAVRTLRYNVLNSSTANTETSHYIDLARDLSAVNRRLMRQGRHYYVKRITVVSANTPNIGDVTNPTTGAVVNQAGRISVSTIPTSWVSQMAWRRGKSTWTKMQAEAQAMAAGDVRATWNDFKVSMTNDFASATKLLPLDNGNNAVDIGEWIYSRLVSPDGTTGEDTFNLHMLGDHIGSVGAWGSVGLIKSYGESRATVNAGDPNVPGDVSEDPLVNVFDYGTTIDEVLNDMEAHNDLPPYEISNYPGDDVNMPKPIVAQHATLSDGKATLGSFVAMCGMLEIESKSPVQNDTYDILIELAIGDYRGIKADVI
ncbi:MAG: hypothetical protein [Circoviridae sp.]|nr:MAG: hypothetical protein [Circoviridae sp.]